MDEDEKQRLRGEVERLGSNGVERIQAVEAFIRAQAGDRGGDVIAGLKTAAQVEGIEKLMASFRTQQRSAAASEPAPSQQPREPPGESSNEPRKWTEEQYQKATPAQRLDYVRQFPQTTNGASR
jgi:hypothetical protein